MGSAPPEDVVLRPICTSCGSVVYLNPKVVTGAVCLSEDHSRVLLCRRAIPPVGKWTIPAGFLEMDETTSEGAVREAMEEAFAEISVHPGALIAVYNIPMANVVQHVFAAVIPDEAAARVRPGEETQEVRFFGWDELDQAEIAFATVEWVLEHLRAVMGSGVDVGAVATGMAKSEVQVRTKKPDGTFV